MRGEDEKRNRGGVGLSWVFQWINISNSIEQVSYWVCHWITHLLISDKDAWSNYWQQRGEKNSHQEIWYTVRNERERDYWEFSHVYECVCGYTFSERVLMGKRMWFASPKKNRIGEKSAGVELKSTRVASASLAVRMVWWLLTSYFARLFAQSHPHCSSHWSWHLACIKSCLNDWAATTIMSARTSPALLFDPTNNLPFVVIHSNSTLTCRYLSLSLSSKW
jgi:hypothetical protein